MISSIISISYSFLLAFLMLTSTQESTYSPITDTTMTNNCPSGYRIFHEFIKVARSPKYQCYGKPSGPYRHYYCPNHELGKYGRGTCSGTYTKQEFCKNGKTTNLYHTNTACTCGCVGKNFHGHRLNILDLKGCGCDDDEQIAVDEF